ncbi:hypothetical protein ACP70R_009794 [Stipagrostis hirtigluma subsp. patula]
MEAEKEVEAGTKGGHKGKRGRRKKGGGARTKEEQEQLKRERERFLEWKKKKDEEDRARDLPRTPRGSRTLSPSRPGRTDSGGHWTEDYGTESDHFDDNTSVPCMRYTFDPPPYGGAKLDIVQIYSVKVAALKGGLQWPLDVFGVVALRDTLDEKRNIIFKRERGNCHTLTGQEPYLPLTGPVRAVMLCFSVVFEFSLYVRGTTECDD